MKKSLQFIIALIAFTLCGGATQAATNYWDLNGATGGAGGASPAGTWDTGVTANWSTDVAGGVATTPWGDGNDAAFAAGSDATGSYTVTLSGTPVVGNLIVKDGAVTISGGTALNIGGGAFLKGIIDVVTNRTLTINSEVMGGDDAGGVTKGTGTTNSGTLVLGGANTYTGQTTLNVGTLSFNTIGDVAAGASALGNPADANAGTIKLVGVAASTATLTYTGAGHNTDRLLNLAGGDVSVLVEASGSGPLVFTSTTGVTATGSGIHYLWLGGTNTGENKITGPIAEFSGTKYTRFRKVRPGTWVLTGNSPFSGVCDIIEGTLIVNSLANKGDSSALGSGGRSAADAIIGLGSNSGTVTNATLKYIGSGHTCNREIRIYGTANPGGGILDASGTGPLVLTGNITRPTGTESFDKTLTLRGANTDTNTLSGTIPDGNNSRKTFFRKEGAGKWILSGVNVYSGDTTISDGTLVGNVGGSCNNSAVSVTAGTATLGVRITDNTKQWTCKSLTYSAAGGLAFGFGSAMVPSGATAPLKVNGNLALTGTPTVAITHDAIPSTTATYPLINYTGTFSGTAPTAVTVTPALTGGATAALQHDTINKVINLVVTGTAGANDLNWGAAGNGNWDVGNAGNSVWKDSTSHTATYYRETVVPGDNVTFEDTDSGGGNHVITMTATVTPTSMTVNSTNAYTITTGGAAVIAGTAGLAKLGSGTLTLSAANTFNGTTRLVAGKLLLTHTSALQNSTLDLGETNAATGTLSFGSLTVTTLGGLKGTNNLSLQNDSSAAVTLSVGNNNANTTYLGALNGAGSFTKIGSGTLTWGSDTSPQMTYAGVTTVSQGAVVISRTDLLPNSTPIVNGTILYGGTMSDLKVNGLSGAGTISMGNASATTPTLTIGEGNGSGSFSGIIQRGTGAGQNIVTKVGTGTQTFSGPNSVGLGSGGFRINAGRVIAKTTTSALGAYGVTVNDPTGTGSATVELNALAMDSLSSQGLTLGTNATLTASGGTSSYTRPAGGPAILNYAQVILSTATAGDTLNLGSAFTGGNASSLVTVSGPGRIALLGGSATGFSGKWKLTGGTLQLGNGDALGNSGTKAIELAGGTLETTLVGNATFSAATVISTNVAMAQNQLGAGGDHNFGTLAITNSTLSASPGSQITDGTTATITFTTTTLSGDATFDVVNNGAKGMRVVLGAVGETGGAWKLIKNGNDRLTLSGNGTYSGGTTLNAGQLNINHAQALGTGTLTISGVSTIANTTIGTPITVTANNPQAWNADFTFGNANADLNLGTGAVTLGANRQLTVSDHKLTVGGIIGDGGSTYSLTKTGPGILALTGANTYAGNTTVSAGMLLVNTPGSLATGSVSVSLGSILGGSGSIGGPVTVASGGTLSPGASIGTLALGSDLTLAGNLLIEVNKALSPSNDVITVSGTLTNAGTGVVTVTNLNGGLPLAPGDSFQLFNKPVLNGSALTIVSAGGEIWVNKLAVDGSIAIAPVTPPKSAATNLTIVAVGPTSFSLGALGAANSAYDVYASTNVGLPMTNWWLIGTTNSDGAGVIQFLDPQATNDQRFYRFGQ